jgi:hypothetical protein
MKHLNIHKFTLEGIIGDDVARQRAQFESRLTQDIRDKGYVPVLDFGPLWAMQYISKKNHFEFVLSVYGVFVGKAESWKIEGINSEGKLLPRIQKSK